MESIRSKIISNIGLKFRTFKSRLTSRYVFGDLKDENPCLKYKHIDEEMFMPAGLGHLRASLRASIHERLCLYSNVALPPLLTPEIERQMGALATVCAPTLKSAMAENTVTLPVAEHHQLTVQRSV